RAARYGILGAKPTDVHVSLCEWQAGRAPPGPADGAVQASRASAHASPGASSPPSGVLVVGHRSGPPVVAALAGRHALDLRAQAGCGGGHDARVVRASAS